MSKKMIYGIFNDEDVLMKAIKSLKEKGIKVADVISPYPIHGMDEALNLNRTRISICCFLYGATGCCLAVLMMWYMNIFDWPMDIGGKPSFALYKNIPAFIPVTFESTVLCAAHGMVITFYLRSKILPGVEPPIYHPRQADDHFVMMVETDESQVATIKGYIQETGAVEIKG
jgi:ActD protein